MTDPDEEGAARSPAMPPANIALTTQELRLDAAGAGMPSSEMRKDNLITSRTLGPSRPLLWSALQASPIGAVCPHHAMAIHSTTRQNYLRLSGRMDGMETSKFPRWY